MVKVHGKMKDYFHEYRMNLIEIASDKIYNFHEKDMRDLFYFTRYVYSNKIHEDQSILEKFRYMTKKAVKTAVILTDIDWIKPEDLEGEGEIDMCEAEKQWKQKMLNEGIHQGIAAGASNKEREMYQIMIEKGFSVEKIADIFSVSMESIEKLLA